MIFSENRCPLFRIILQSIGRFQLVNTMGQRRADDARRLYRQGRSKSIGAQVPKTAPELPSGRAFLFPSIVMRTENANRPTPGFHFDFSQHPNVPSSRPIKRGQARKASRTAPQ